jgi:hypothetical protein
MKPLRAQHPIPNTRQDRSGTRGLPCEEELGDGHRPNVFRGTDTRGTLGDGYKFDTGGTKRRLGLEG